MAVIKAIMLSCFYVLSLSLMAKSSLGSPLDLVVLHTNDAKARIVETTKYGSDCSDEDSVAGECYGGVARRATKISEMRNLYPNVLLADGGDQFQGTLWYFYYKGMEAAHFMNMMGYDVMAFGNHEFDNGVQSLVDFLEVVNFPVICSNIDASNEPLLKDRFRPYTEKEYGGETVGIVGYITKKTNILVDPDGVKNLVFLDEVTQVRQVVEDMKLRGINKIIALGHAGFEMDQKIAKEVDGVDIVIGGHSNTFLYTGDPPSNEEPMGPYPVVVTQDSGATALVVQDFAFGKYLGFLNVHFNEDGELTEWEGNPILLDNSVERDPEVLAEVEEWEDPVVNFSSSVVGEARVFLDGSRQSCRLEECTMGDLMTDSLLYNYLLMTTPGNGSWSDTALVLWNGGGIRTSIIIGPVKVADILQVLPFRNEVVMVRIKGEAILEALEHSASLHDPVDAEGGWLQMSGVRVVYDLNQPVGKRVVQVSVRCSDCEILIYEELDPEKEYGVLISAYMVNGGDGYSMFKENLIVENYLGFLASDWLMTYFEQHSPVIQEHGARITFVEDDEGGSPDTSTDEGPSDWTTGDGEEATPIPCLTATTGTASLSPSVVLTLAAAALRALFH